MLIAGPWFAPMMLDEAGAGHRVAGELYAIGQARLQAIDALESIGRPGNLRRRIRVEPSQGGLAVAAFVYMKDRSLATPQHSGWLSDYQDRRFVPFEER